MTATECRMKSVSPNIFVQDIRKTIEFYEIIGFEVVTTIGDQDDPGPRHILLMTKKITCHIENSYEIHLWLTLKGTVKVG